jgi:acyl-CoA thioester hydrolase
MHNFYHVTSIEVRFRDLDVLGHVNNGVIFTYIETARIRYLIDVGIRSPLTGWNDLAFILAHINCDFRKPIFYGQRVKVGSRIVEIKQSSLRLAHRVEADGELAAEGDGVLVHYDYAIQSSTPIPPVMRAKIEAFERTTFNV